LKTYPVDSIAQITAHTLGFSEEYADSLAVAMTAYRDTQGYKFFDGASRHNLHDMDIANQRFQSLEPQMKHALRAQKIIQSKDSRLTYPVYTSLPTPSAMAQTGQEELHRLHWKQALNYAVVSYNARLTDAYQAGEIHDTQSWSQWNKNILQDTGYIPGAGAHVVELGAFSEQRFGFWPEEHQQLRGVNEGRHGTHSEHYAHKYHQYGSDLAKALDIFGPQRQYGRDITAQLDSFYQYHVLPNRRALGVPEAVTDSVRSKTEENKFVNPGRAVWYFRGHYGDHIHVSMMKRCVVDYNGQAFLDAEIYKRQEIIAPFERGNKKVPVMSYDKKDLPPHKNILVYGREKIVPLDSNYQWIGNLETIKKMIQGQEKPQPKSHQKKLRSKKTNYSGTHKPKAQNHKVSYQQNGDAWRQPTYDQNLIRNKPINQVNFS
jgi:hypothetical protein